MITANGKVAIARYLAGQVPSIADTLVLGVGSAAASVNDVRLQYETVRVPISSINADLANNRLVFKAAVAPGGINTVYEIGLYASSFLNNGYVSLPVLGSIPSLWTNAILTSDNARAYTQVAKIDFVASGTTNAELTGFNSDLSHFTDLDYVVVGFYGTANLSSARIRLGSDASNYYEFTLASPSVGYNIYRLNRSAATKTGSPTWAAISYIAVRPSATAAGPGSLYFDGIRFESNNLSDTDFLVARTVLDAPLVMSPSVASDVEYSLGISVT